MSRKNSDIDGPTRSLVMSGRVTSVRWSGLVDTQKDNLDFVTSKVDGVVNTQFFDQNL